MGIRRISNYSNSSTDELLRLSLEALGLRVWANGVISAVGVLAIVCNMAIIVIIAKSRLLRTKCFALIATNASIDAMMGLSYLLTGIKRIQRYRTGEGEVMSRWNCFLEVQFNILLQLMSLAMDSALVADRFVAIVRPIRYKQLTYAQLTMPLIGASILYTLAQYGASAYDSYNSPKKSTLFNCGTDDCLSDDMLTILMSIQIVTSFVTILLNVLLAMVVKSKKSQALNGEREERVLKVITATVIVHIFVYLASRVWILLAPHILEEMAEVITDRYIRDLAVLCAATNFAFLLMTSSDFRQETKKMIGWKENAIEPVGGSPPG